MRLFGHETIQISASTQVTRATNALDVVLAIDMSGSMTGSAGGGQTRIQAARSAATELVNILFGEDAIKDHLKIGVVPWNSKVNATLNGVAFDSGLTVSEAVTPFTHPITGAVQSVIWKANNSPVPLLDQPQPDWKGCVYSRYLPGGTDDDDGDIQLYDVSSAAGDWVAWEPIKTAEGEPTSSFWTTCTAAGGGWGTDCGPCLSHGITPMNSTKQTVLDAIGALQSPAGQTNIPQGLGWGWRVLMPGEPFSQADPNPPGYRQQAIVLLTDGQNVGGYGDGYKAVFGLNSAAQDDMDDRLRLLAANVKAQGVLIYTIQFGDNPASTQQLLKDVATSPDQPYYSYAPDGASLQQVFQEIANHLSQLHLSM
jgi:Mg-chelatase subunit ChlD